MNRTVKFVTAGLAAAALSVGGAAFAWADTAEDGEAQSLAYMLEEERVAHDLYTALGEKYDSVVWDRIAPAEQRHHDAVERLLKLKDLDVPEAQEAGSYADKGLQDLYDEWLARGLESEEEAFQVGIELEQADIADLEATIKDFEGDDDVTGVLEALLRGSERHEAAFTRWADGEGMTGEPLEWAGQRAAGAGNGSATCDGTGIQDRTAAQDGSGDANGPGAMGQRGRRGGGMGLMDGSGNMNAPRRAAADS